MVIWSTFHNCYSCNMSLQVCIRGAYIRLHILYMIVIYYYNGSKIVIYDITPSPTERRWWFTRIIIIMIIMIILDYHHRMEELPYYQPMLLVRCLVQQHHLLAHWWSLHCGLEWPVSHSFKKAGNLLQMGCHNFWCGGWVWLVLLMGLPGCLVPGGPVVGVLHASFCKWFDDLLC